MVVLKIGTKEINLHDKKVEALISTFADKKRKIDELNTELKSIKDDVIEFAKEKREDSKSLALIVKDNGIKISFSDEIKIENVAELRELLGGEFGAFVKEEVKAKSGLRNLITTNSDIRNCAKIVEKTPTVTLLKV